MNSKTKPKYRYENNEMSKVPESESIYEFTSQNKMIAIINGDMFSLNVNGKTYHSYYPEGEDFFDY